MILVDQKQDDQKGLNVNLNPQATPVLYTENIFMNASEDGVVIDICQRLGNTNQLQIVARVGMSKSHAKKFLKAFGDLINMSEGQLQTGKVARA